MQPTITTSFYPANRHEWRQWLQNNHHRAPSVWLVYYRTSSGVSSLTHSEAVDEALCFGWIDSLRKSLDDERFIQFFTKRKPNSGWSKVNKAKIERLIKAGLMTEAGFTSIKTAKKNASWTVLDKVEKLSLPKDLAAAFKPHRGAKAFFLGLSRSSRKALLQWVVLAKRPETRQSRINEVAVMAAQKLKPKQFRQAKS